MRNLYLNLHIKDNKISIGRKIYVICRYFVAFIIITYGWAKLTGSQFTILDSELDKPLGEVSGFWLTWYYFGFSPVYGNFVALIQILFGFLLLFRKTTLLAACVLFPLIANIILIDIFYGIDLGALTIALILGIALTIILYFHRAEIIKTFWTIQNAVFPNVERKSVFGYIKLLAIVVIAVFPPVFTYYVANHNNRLPTELDGKWRVISTAPVLREKEKDLTKIYFERNRAFMAVFRYGDDLWMEHHFEINPQTNQIGIWDKWLSKNNELFQGTYRVLNNTLLLEGRWIPTNQLVKIELVKQN